MKNSLKISNVGELKLIRIIEELIFERMGNKLIRDDCFFFSLVNKVKNEYIGDLVFNSDMLVSTTDVPPQMNAYQIGRKAVLMNISDLIVKGVKPLGIFISLGLPEDMRLKNFKEIIFGIIDYCKKLKIEYIGGDLNETKEIIINPTVFGIQDPSKLINRSGMKSGDYLVANRKFGLTGVGFDILLSKKTNIENFTSYQRSLNSILKPEDIGYESFILSENNLATASIDSSDGLAKSLIDLMFSNPKLGFEIEFDDQLIEEEAIKYSQEVDFPLEDLVFNAGEEFIHLFTINPKDYNTAKKLIRDNNGQLYLIGKVISDEKIFFFSKGRKNELKHFGFEHFK